MSVDLHRTLVVCLFVLIKGSRLSSRSDHSLARFEPFFEAQNINGSHYMCIPTGVRHSSTKTQKARGKMIVPEKKSLD